MLASHKRKAEVPYIYTSLECLSRASPSRPQRVNVFGIAQNVSVKEENDQILVQFTLLDEKSNVHCRIFTETDDSLHLKASDGCIVRLHRVQAKCVQSSEDSKIILGGRLRTFGLAVVVFRYGPQESPDVVYSSSKNYSIDEEDFKRVADLANFYRNRNPTAKDSHVEGSLLAVDSGAYSSTTSVMEVDDPVDGETGKESGRSCDVGEGDSSSAADSVCAVLTNKRKLQDVVLRQYFDLVAQVIAVFTSDLGNVVVRCWDTTKIKVPPFSFSEDIISSYLSRDQHLSDLAAGFSVDVVLYGEHGDKARGKIKAGDIVVMRNLHFYLKSGDRLIVMHDGATGKRFSRGIDVLPSCDMKTMLLHEIEKHEQRPTTGISDLAHPPVVTMQYAPHESRSRMFTAMMITSELKNIVMNKENTFISKNNDAAGCLVKETLEVLLIRLCLFQILESDKNNILPLIAEKCKEDPNANHAQVVKAVLFDSVLKLVCVMHSPLPDCGRKIRQKISRQGNILPEPAFPSSVVFDRLWYTHFSHCLLGYEFRLSRPELPPLSSHACPLLAAECPECGYWGKARSELLKKYPLCFNCFKQDMSVVKMEQLLYIQLISKEIAGNRFRFLFPYDLLEFFGVHLPYSENECLKMCDDRPSTENLRLLWSAIDNRFAQMKIVISVLKLRASDRKSFVFEIKKLIVSLRS